MLQQDTERKKLRHVYVQTPEGKEIFIAEDKQQSDLTPEKAEQSAENTPTESSSEVTDGEEG